MVVHGGICRKENSMTAMLAVHGEAVEKCVAGRAEIAARLR